MTYPTTAVVTTNMDVGTDSPAAAQTDLLDAVQKLNQMIAHTTAFAATLLDDASASAARATLEVAPRATRIDVASASTVNLTSSAPDTDDIRITGTTSITAFTVAVGRVVRVTASAAHTLTNNANIVTQTGANIVCAAGDTYSLRATAANVVEVFGFVEAAKIGQTIPFPRAYISGLQCAPAGGSASMPIAAGQAADSANAVLMSLASTLTKTTSAWAVGSGNGGLDTGTIANATWYYWYLIRRPDTGVVDAVCSLSNSAPTLPGSYTQYRYIGAGLTDGSGQWTKITQFGDTFMYATPPAASFNAAGSTTAALLTLPVPLGRKVEAIINIGLQTSVGSYLSDPDNTDVAPNLSATPLATQASGYSQARIVTNTSGQIRHRETAAGATIIVCLGWVDLRGQNL